MDEYLYEKRYALLHLLFTIGLSLCAFILIGIVDSSFVRHLLLLKFLFGGFSLFSIFYYSFIVRFPNKLVYVRKLLLIFLDIAALTLCIIIVGKSGLFLLPLYILVVMESGINFGLNYFYFSLIVSSLSWIELIKYSDYWKMNINTVAIFAITTFLIPLMYLKKITYMHEEQEILHETLQNTEEAANYDTLTGLLNRKYYDDFMKKVLKEREFFALLFIDLNKFKVINDMYGHDVGDAVLIEVAKRLHASIDEDDILARLGGDEFVIITKRKKVFLSKFLKKLERITMGTHQVDDVDINIELSIGISLFPDDSKSETFLRKYADAAMYSAKKRKNTYHVFYEEIKSSEDSC